MQLLKTRKSGWLIGILLCSVLFTGCVGGRFNPDGWAAPAISDNRLYAISQKNGEFLAVDLSDSVDVRPSDFIDLTPPLDEASSSLFGCEGPDPKLVGYATPVVANGVAYIADYDGKIYAVDTEKDGVPAWREPVETDGPIVADPILYDRDGDDIDDTLLVASGKQLLAIDTQQARFVWEQPFEADGKIWSNPVIDNGHVYFGTLRHKLYSVNLASGEGKLLQEFDGPVTSKPLIHDGVLYIGTFDSKFFAINISTGDQVWEFSVGDWFWSEAVYYDGIVYVGCRDENVYALNAETGQLEWEAPVNGPVRAAAAVVLTTQVEDDASVEVPVLLIATKTGEGAVYGFDLRTAGEMAWREIPVGKVYADPWIEGTTAYYLNENDELYAIDVVEGDILWDISLDRD